ncbi:extensin-like [Girardinichthys multiradiatus]|uniref:extensin-like n=1 Tax=Girardinichthys multiradiatus TaxID=208333 RepID=UPI001FAD3938|nr:extensin-like [Girardinichthys multiradiatus]
MLRRPIHLTANRSPAPDHGPEPHKEAVEEGHGSTSYRAPANSTPKPGGHPSPPATHTPAWRTTAHQAVQPASPSTTAGPHPNQRWLRPPYWSLEPPQPADQGPRSKGTQAIPREGTAKTTNPNYTQPTRNHPANEQTPPQHKAKKTDASAELSDARPAAPRPGDPSEPPPPDTKGTGVSNRNQDKEPETEPEPPKTKQRPHPSRANHPSPPQKETYTHTNIRTTPRAHKTLDTQVDPAPPPPADPPPRQQNYLKVIVNSANCKENPSYTFKACLADIQL